MAKKKRDSKKDSETKGVWRENSTKERETSWIVILLKWKENKKRFKTEKIEKIRKFSPFFGRFSPGACPI